MVTSYPLVHSNHASIVWVDVVDILGAINAEWDHCQAYAASEETDKSKNQPRKHSTFVFDRGHNL